jgi:hypothetical protein
VKPSRSSSAERITLQEVAIRLNLDDAPAEAVTRGDRRGEQMQRLTAGMFCVALCLSAPVLNVPAIAQDNPFITTDWADLEVGQNACLDRAERAIAKNGFKSPGTTKFSRHGYLDQYTVAVRCAADKGFVFFVVAGPRPELTEQYESAIKNDF